MRSKLWPGLTEQEVEEFAAAPENRRDAHRLLCLLEHASRIRSHREFKDGEGSRRMSNRKQLLQKQRRRLAAAVVDLCAVRGPDDELTLLAQRGLADSSRECYDQLMDRVETLPEAERAALETQQERSAAS